MARGSGGARSPSDSPSRQSLLARQEPLRSLEVLLGAAAQLPRVMLHAPRSRRLGGAPVAAVLQVPQGEVLVAVADGFVEILELARVGRRIVAQQGLAVLDRRVQHLLGRFPFALEMVDRDQGAIVAQAHAARVELNRAAVRREAALVHLRGLGGPAGP